MQVALGRLQNDHVAIATLVGWQSYESEAAFSRAFKRTFGMAPGRRAWPNVGSARKVYAATTRSAR